MRIALPTLYRREGGSTKVLLACAGALAARHDVIVRGPLAAATSRHGLSVPASIEGPAAKARALPLLAAAMTAESAWLARARPDLLHVHDEPTLYAYGPAARALGIPVLWHVHMREGTGHALRLRHRLARAKIFVSAFMVGPCQPLPHAVIRNPVRLVARGAPDAGAGAAIRLAVIGQLSDNKNQALALATLAALRARGVAASLALYGAELQPGYRAWLERQIAALSLGDGTWLAGSQPLEAAIKATDVLLAPSRYESQHLAVLEALGAGLPVVASPIAAHREIAGLIASPGLTIAEPTPAAFAEAVLAARPDPASPAAVARHYGFERFAAELLAFIDTLAPGERR